MDKGIDCFYNGSVKKILVDEINNKLYISGTFSHDGNCIPLRGIASWDGLHWNSIGDASEGNATKLSITLFNDTLYCYGIFFNANTNQYLAKWDGIKWDTLPGSPNNVLSFLQKDNDLFMAGGMDYLGGDSTFLLGKFDGNIFTGLTPYYGFQGGNIISCMAMFLDTLYVGGNFHMMPYKNLSDFAKWDGNDLQIVSNDFANLGALSLIESMVVYNNELYIGGFFRKADGYAGDFIMKWNGSQFSEVGTGMNERVTCMKVYNNELFVGGCFTQAGGISSNYVAKWNGSSWSSLSNHAFVGSYPMVIDLNFYKDSLIIAGTFTSIDGDTTLQRIAKYSQPFVGINDMNVSNLVNIYPNPAKDILSVEITTSELLNATVIIKNSLGQTVKKLNSSCIGVGGIYEIDISNDPAGLYLIQLTTLKTTICKKFIKN
jgi:hypothetical protein